MSKELGTAKLVVRAAGGRCTILALCPGAEPMHCGTMRDVSTRPGTYRQIELTLANVSEGERFEVRVAETEGAHDRYMVRVNAAAELVRVRSLEALPTGEWEFRYPPLRPNFRAA